MTSSLVGSEMCIRDRSEDVPENPAPPRNRRGQATRPWGRLLNHPTPFVIPVTSCPSPCAPCPCAAPPLGHPIGDFCRAVQIGAVTVFS
eukprot:5772667-Prorocentrum_lima.AAC.1